MLGGPTNDKSRTGRIIYTLGNLRALQGRDDEALRLHLQSYQLFLDTLSIREIPNTRHKLAEHFIRLQRYEEAM